MQKHNRKAIFEAMTPTLETRLGQRHLTETPILESNRRLTQ